MKYSKGLICKASEVEVRMGIEGHPKVKAYPLLRTAQATIGLGEEGARFLTLSLDEIEPGGGLEPHYHIDAPVFDHAFYVISGRILARIGDKEEEVEADSIIYFPSDVLHSIKNIGSQTAKVLRLAASATGDTVGRVVYVK